MNALHHSVPAAVDDETWMEYVRQKAHAAIVIDLKEFDWSRLTPDVARQIHALIPHD